MAVHVWPSINDIGPSPGMGKTISEVNLTALIKALLAQNFVVSGFTVPASSATLTLTIAAGEAIISGYRVVIDSSTDVTCTANATNHIFLKLTKDVLGNVTGAVFEVNTTGTAPADSVKIATAVAGASSITSTTDVRVTLALANRELLKTVDGPGSGLVADDSDKVDGYHAGTGPNNVLKLDANGKVPAGNLPGGVFVFAGDAPYNQSETYIFRTDLDTDDDVWLTVGPTGSGANIIWTALDVVPTGAKGIRLNVLAQVYHSSATSGTYFITTRFRKYGSSVFPRESVYARADLPGERDEERNTIDVPVGPNRIFEFMWEKASTDFGDLFLTIYLAGWYL